MIARLPGVTAVQATGTVHGISVYKSPYIPSIETNGLSVDAATLGLPAVAGTSLAQGRFLDAATAREPVAVLGAAAARLMGIDRIRPGLRIWVGGQWFYVTGILDPAAYAPQIDSAVLVGFPAAQKYLNFDGHPSQLYVRTTDTQAAVTRRRQPARRRRPTRRTPARSTSPGPRTRSTARADAKGALDTLFLGLGAVALLVGAIGVANIMVISVLERRSEIGLRRALGATRGQIRAQFLAEAILLSLAGGVAGVALGAAATAAYARGHGEAVVIPARAWAGRPGRGRRHRRPRRPAARHPRRPPLPHPGPPGRPVSRAALTQPPRCSIVVVPTTTMLHRRGQTPEPGLPPAASWNISAPATVAASGIRLSTPVIHRSRRGCG